MMTARADGHPAMIAARATTARQRSGKA